MNWKPLILGTAGSLALAAGAAQAQTAEPWSGVYVGANGGWNWADERSNTTTTVNQLSGLDVGGAPVTVPPTTFDSIPGRRTDNGFQGGGQLGFNVQRGWMVFGLEGDFDGVTGWGRQADGYTLPATGLTTGSTLTADYQARPHWEATARGRLGVAFHRMLVYGTGGAAWVNLRDRAAYAYDPSVAAGVTPAGTYGPYDTVSEQTATRLGWTAGGGVEYLLSPSVSVGAEYRHTGIGDYNVALGSNTPGGVYETGRANFRDDAVLARINFKFGGGWLPHW